MRKVNNAVEKVLEKRERPKVMQKDESIVFIGPEEAGRWYHGQNESISLGKVETFFPDQQTRWLKVCIMWRKVEKEAAVLIHTWLILFLS